MIAHSVLKGPLALPLVAGAAGLVLGLLIGLFPEFSEGPRLHDEWAPLPQIETAAVQPLLQDLLASQQWEKLRVEEDSEEELLKVPGRPGVMAYLRVVAIVKEPRAEALLRVNRLPRSLQQELLMKPDANNVITVHEGDLVASGWKVVQIQETGVTLGQAPETVAEGSDPQLVEYNLYEWNR